MIAKYTQRSDIMENSNLYIHDFLTLYSNHAYIVHGGLDLLDNLDYAKYVVGSSVADIFVCASFPIAIADVVEGVWCTTCKVCNTVSVLRKNCYLWLCQTCVCSTEVVVFYRVDFRLDWYDVEQVLLQRSRVNRNAYSYENIVDLLKENEDNL